MTIDSTQTIIKIGTSAGVTLPAKDLKYAGLQVGDVVRIKVEPVEMFDPQQLEVVQIAQKLIERHQKALRNLSQR